MNNMAKNLLLWLLIAAVLLSVFNNFNLRSATEQVGFAPRGRHARSRRERAADSLAALTLATSTRR